MTTKTYYNWKKGFLDKTFNIFSNGKPLGLLIGKAFSKSAELMINGEKFRFLTNGFFKQETTIYNLSDNKPIGQVTFNSLMTKAEIRLRNEMFQFRYNNIFNTRWTILGLKGTVINYSGSSRKGNIESNINDNLLIATGLFVTNHYWQTSVAVMFAAFLPIWIIIIN